MAQREFSGLTRFVPSSSSRYHEFLSAAEEYTFRLTEDHRAGLLIKPLDAGNHHVNYLRSTYSVLNTIDKLHLPSGSTVVDAGAGPGWLSEQLLLLGYRVIVLEPSQDMLNVAHLRISRASAKWGIDLMSRAEFVHAGIEGLPPHLDGSGVAQAVLFHEAWHHVIQEDVAARNVFNLLAPGGQIAVLIEGRWYPGVRSLEDALDKEMQDYGTLESPFTREYMHFVLESAGFEDITFYHAVNGLFSADQGGLRIAEAAGEMHEMGWNNCIARSPPALNERSLAVDATLARLSVQSVEHRPGSTVCVTVRAQNIGRTTWRANGRRGQGLVTLGMLGIQNSGVTQEIIGRGTLPRDVVPNESVSITGEFDLVPGFDSYAVSLVAEGAFWFEQRLPLDCL